MKQIDLKRLELQFKHYLSEDNVAYYMMGLGYDPKECTLNEVMDAVDSLLSKGLIEEANHGVLRDDERIRATRSIREEYYRLIEQERGLIGADTVLDMIDSALKV